MARPGKGQQCAYCRRTLEARGSNSRVAATRDHVVPKAATSAVIGSHLKVWCCRQCNTLKANMLPAAWSAFMRENPEWWKRPEFQGGIKLRDRCRFGAPQASVSE